MAMAHRLSALTDSPSASLGGLFCPRAVIQPYQGRRKMSKTGVILPSSLSYVNKNENYLTNLLQVGVVCVIINDGKERIALAKENMSKIFIIYGGHKHGS
jgi:hypothetical protein